MKLIPAIVAACLSAAATGPAATAQTLTPAEPDTIMAAVTTCLNVVEAGGIDEAQLAELGWQRATAQRDGKTVELELGLYGKSGSNALIMAHEGSKMPVCLVMARLQQTKEYQAILDAIDAIDGIKAVKQEELEILFMSDRRIIQSERLGSPAEATVRIAVSALPEKS